MQVTEQTVTAQRSLAEWLDYQQTCHPSEMELGLDRVRRVAEALSLLPACHQTITVAGTNGKGSTATLVSGLVDSHSRVGVYTSPHLWRYNERIVIDGQPVSDKDLVHAFEIIDEARGDISLTYFEFGTLAALWLFARAGVDMAVLEVGLGGRLDAVNIVDADVALVTSIGLDHTQWLGQTREAIGVEKAGIMRRGRPALCGDRQLPASVPAYATEVGAKLALIGRDFDLRMEEGRWCGSGRLSGFQLEAHPAVFIDNLALALAGVLAAGYVPQTTDVIRACRLQAELPGRCEVIDGPVPIIYDVAHNEGAMDLLITRMQRQPVSGRTHIVLGMLADKAVEAVSARLAPVADAFYPAGLEAVSSRGLAADELARRMGYAGPLFSDPRAALGAARAAAASGDRIIVCGSFHTVAEARSPDR